MLQILFCCSFFCCWILHVFLTVQVTEWLRTRSLKAPRVLPSGSWPFIPQKRSSKTSTDTLHIWSRRGLTEPGWQRLVALCWIRFSFSWNCCERLFLCCGWKFALLIAVFVCCRWCHQRIGSPGAHMMTLMIWWFPPLFNRLSRANPVSSLSITSRRSQWQSASSAKQPTQTSEQKMLIYLDAIES